MTNEDNSNPSDNSTPSAVSEVVHPPVRLRGRPPGSKNKVKVPVVHTILPTPSPMMEFIPSYLQNIHVPSVVGHDIPLSPPPPMILKDGLPNLPEVKLIGRPLGSPNKSPRRKQTPPSATTEPVPTPVQIIGYELVNSGWTDR